MTVSRDITVIWSTYNRAPVLRQTLEAMQALDRDGLDVEFVVVDNNSDDATKEVIEEFAALMPLNHLFEPQAGKNKALNRALAEVELGELVVFTDDDVVPAKDWLKAVSAIANRWPKISVFGGKIDLIWPDQKIPDWALNNEIIQRWAYSRHDFGDGEHVYEKGMYPFGANFWVRRQVFADGRRYDEGIGPQAGKTFKMGSETSLLQSLEGDGYKILYAPSAVVGHQVQVFQLDENSVRRRAFRLGLGRAHQVALDRADLFARHPNLWRLKRYVSILRDLCRYGLTRLTFWGADRFEKSVEANMWLAYNIETLRIANQKAKEA